MIRTPPAPPTLGTGALVPTFPRIPRPAPPRGARCLGGSWFRVHAFETRRPGEPLSAPPRTVGHACLLLGADAPLTVGAKEAAEVCSRGEGPPPSEESAREKVIFCNSRGDTLVYQADRAKASAALCACGNASGASAALLAHSLGVARVRQSLVLPDGQVPMRAAVRPDSGGWHVEQSWLGVRLEAHGTEMLGLPAAVCTGTLNHYVIVALPDRARLDSFTLADALALWGQARERFGFDDPLRSRLAAVCLGGGLPRAKFFTSGRAHPGAPLTGLAALALAAGQVDWLAPLARVGRLEHRRGIDSLPQVRNAAGGARVELCPIHVLLRVA
jgi:hypothetical protein